MVNPINYLNFFLFFWGGLVLFGFLFGEYDHDMNNDHDMITGGYQYLPVTRTQGSAGQLA